MFDSHSHGPNNGALVAVSSGIATVGSMGVYLSQYFDKQFALGSMITLRNGVIVNREYQFSLLSV